MSTLGERHARCGPRARSLVVLCIAAFLGLAGWPPVSAHAQLHEVLVRFLPPADSVNGYRIYVTDQDLGSEDVLDPGFIPADPDGIARTYVVLDSAHAYLLEMTAYNDAGESPRSNAIAVAAVTCDASLCDDGNPCTLDSCDAQGCLLDLVADGTSCDDGFVDTVNDVCSAGTCAGESLVCNDHADCDDGDVCNGLESCDGGFECLAGTPLDCGPETQCSIPRCDPSQGCFTELVPDGTLCDDGLAETLDDACLSGACVGSGTPEPPPADSDLYIESISPNSVTPGRHELMILGWGFTAKPRLFFENGDGRKPRIRYIDVQDEGTLLVGIKARQRGLKAPTAWDLRLRMPDGREIFVPKALLVSP